MRILSDPAFLATIQSSVQKILRLEKGGKNAIAKGLCTMNHRPVVSHSLFVEDDHPESVKTRTPVTENHLEKTVHDAHVPGPSKLSESMVTGVSTDPGPSMQSPISLTSLLTTVPFQPPPKEDEPHDTSTRNSNPESAFEATNTPKMMCNDAKMPNNQANIANVEVMDLNSQAVLHM